MEPNRCCVSSITLLLLKIGITHHPPNAGGAEQATVDYNQMATAQKLLLFWRKHVVSYPRLWRASLVRPRKCWWTVQRWTSLKTTRPPNPSSCGLVGYGHWSAVLFVATQPLAGMCR